ncbi:MAG TPA: hypothetical protein VFD48_00340 [Pyrinomonadaceae bacterium]|nr:hypothetical protein [Pyrinomonadaceae bacterium]
MSDFGVAGKLTIREFDAVVKVRVSNGEYLHFNLTVKGAEPIFSFVCKHRVRLSERDFDSHPKQVYAWTWSKGQNEADAADDTYGVIMSFIAAVRYTLRVEHRDRDDNLINLLKDIDYESQHAADSFTETIRVFTA